MSIEPVWNLNDELTWEHVKYIAGEHRTSVEFKLTLGFLYILKLHSEHRTSVEFKQLNF